MTTERWKWRSTATSGPTQPTQSAVDLHDADAKKPRVLSKALRSMSSSSLESNSTAPPRSSNSVRRLHKNHSGSGSMIERLHRRMSKDSAVSVALSDGASSPMESSYASMEVIQHGSLRPDSSSRKSKAEYLVLTDRCLAKFANVEAARTVFPQLDPADPQLQRSSSSASIQSKRGAITEPRLEINHSSIVAVFNEGIPATRHDLDVWWAAPTPRASYYRTQLNFTSSKEMDEWLTIIHRTCRTRMRKGSANGYVPENIRARINHVVATTESIADVSQVLIFPVVKRTFGPNSRPPVTDDLRSPVDLSSFYLAIGPYMCYLVEFLRADVTCPPAELRAKITSFGTVTLSRFRASVATHTQSFIIGYRPPFGQDVRLDLASVHYRRIIETLIRVDRALKPMWPQQLQQTIFDIRGLPPPLQLTSGNDLGGLETSLLAYCVAFNVAVPNWKIEWNAPSQPCFRLLPATGAGYTALQLLAIFRALRYNSFFKAISFEGVDMTSLAGKTDPASQGESLVYTSASLLKISEERFHTLSTATILEQEIHSLLFAADSIRSINLSNVLGLEKKEIRSFQPRHAKFDSAALYKLSSEMIGSVLQLLRRQLSHCHSVSFSGNPMAPKDIDELVLIAGLDSVHLRLIEVAGCGLGEYGLSKLWTALASQTSSLRALDTSFNHGTAKFETVQSVLSQLHGVTKLNIANNTRINSEESLFDEAALSSWVLEELDLSGIMLNDATIKDLASYLASPLSQNLHTLRLNSCGLSGHHVASLIVGMGPNRGLALHVNSARLDSGIEELCEALVNGNGPWCLFAEMVDFYHEENFVELLRALTANNSIQCLSLLGVSTSDDAGDTACQAIHDLFAQNKSIRYLDLSGYESKLDEGRLGRGFAKALRGIKDNTTLEHLRIRSQMLNINVGDLAEAIASNNTLLSLDCESNDFNLSNFRHLTNHVERNISICHLSAFSEKELAKTIQKSVDTAAVAAPTRRGNVMSKLRSDKQATGGKVVAQDLKDEWDVAVQHLNICLKRNQDLARDQLGAGDLDPSSFDCEAALSATFGGLALDDYDHKMMAIYDLSAPLSQVYLDDAVEEQVKNPDSVRRSTSTNSGASNTPSSDVVSTESGVPTPADLQDVSGVAISPDGEGSPVMVYGEPSEPNYLYCDGLEMEGGLQMKRYKRFGSDPNNRIDEEDV